MVQDAIANPTLFTMPTIVDIQWWPEKVQKELDAGIPVQFPSDIFTVPGLVIACES